MTKLRVRLYEAVLGGNSLDFKARADGYNHTGYLETKGIDTQILATFPTDDDIQVAAEQAMEECVSLVTLPLGLDPTMLRDTLARQTQLPEIDA